MKLAALALDYDGTIATDGIVEQTTRAAIELLRRSGVAVIVVTGRSLSDLRQAAGDLHFADAIVAENGAVLAFPAAGRTRVLARPLAPAFVQELRKQGLPFESGQCLLSADADYTPAILEVIRRLHLPLSTHQEFLRSFHEGTLRRHFYERIPWNCLVLVFNAGRVMALPESVGKGSGLRAALRELRVSQHNAVGIGNAENDHSLLEVCELGLAVEWGSGALKSTADGVLAGAGPADVATFLTELGTAPGLVPVIPGRHSLVLGESAPGIAETFDLADGNALIVGDSVSGKSWAAGLIAEQWIQHGYSVCLIDPEGDYEALAAMPHVIHFGGKENPPSPAAVAGLLRDPELSVVVGLSNLRLHDKRHYVHELLSQINELRQRAGSPHRVIIDEAHFFLGEPTSGVALDLEQGGYLFVTYRLADMSADILSTCGTVICTRLTRPREVAALDRIVPGMSAGLDVASVLRDLPIGDAMLLRSPPEKQCDHRRVRLAARTTGHVRHRVKYLNIPVPGGKEFVFSRDGQPIGERVATIRDFATLVREIDAAVLQGHLQRGDFSRWIADVFADRALAREVGALETVYRYESVSDLRKALAALIEERYAIG